LYKKHIQKYGSATQRARPSLTLPVTNPTDITEQMLKQPRDGRSSSTRTTAVRSKRARRNDELPEDPTAGIVW